MRPSARVRDGRDDRIVGGLARSRRHAPDVERLGARRPVEHRLADLEDPRIGRRLPRNLRADAGRIARP